MTITMTVPSTHSTESVATRIPVWRVGALATLGGAIVTEAFSLLARAIDIPMAAADPGADAAKDIPVGGFAMAVVLARRARRPAHTFAVTTVALTVLSLLGPILATHTATATRSVLFVAHIIAAAIVIPPITRRLAQEGR